jgi:hypothetical protein
VDRETETIDYGEVERLAKRHRPRMIVAGASAYPRFFDFKALSEIARAIDALLMVDMAHIAGLVAAGVHPSPIPYSDVVTSTTHKTLRGPRGGLILARDACSKKINSQVFPGIQGGPLMHVIAAKAVAFKEALGASFRLYQKNIVTNAAALADALKDNGLDLVSGGTDNHLMLVNLSRSRLDVTGRDAEIALGRAGITVNKNAIPYETRSPHVTSGIRIGTPYVTSRGMMAEQMKVIGGLMAEVLHDPENETLLKKTRARYRRCAMHFPCIPRQMATDDKGALECMQPTPANGPAISPGTIISWPWPCSRPSAARTPTPRSAPASSTPKNASSGWGTTDSPPAVPMTPCPGAARGFFGHQIPLRLPRGTQRHLEQCSRQSYRLRHLYGPFSL